MKVTKLRYGDATIGKRFTGIVEVHAAGKTTTRQVTDYIRKSVLPRQPANPEFPLQVMRFYHVGRMPREL